MRVVRALGLVIAGVALCSAAGAGELAAGADAPRQSTFKSGVEVVALNVTVLDPQQRLVSDLGRQDFAVFEDGVLQQIAYFETSEVPLDLAILIDTSVSMGPKLGFVRKAAANFARMLRPGDRAAVFGFSGQVQVLTPFTSDPAEITSAIDRTQSGGATALYNAVYVALREFGRAVSPTDAVRRRAIVVLSDGEDTASLLSFDETLAEVRRAGVTIYAIGLRTDAFTPGPGRGRPFFSQADYAMKALAQETGATVHFPQRPSDLDAAYAAIGQELARQYAIGYVSSNPMRNGAFRRVVVRLVERPEMRSRTRTGYLAASAASVLASR
jgi:Ca-activated chloride channel family protein